MSEPNQNLATPKVDQVGGKTIYEASSFEIFWRHFLAGFSRALGGLFIYLIFIYLLILASYKFAYPKIEPLISTLSDSINSLQDLNSSSSLGSPDIKSEVQRLLDQKSLQQVIEPNK